MLDHTPRRDLKAGQGRSQSKTGVIRQGDWPVIPRNRFCVGGWSLLVHCSHDHVEKEDMS